MYVGQGQAQIQSGRIWPARDYTRLTLESGSSIKHSLFSVKDPERLVLDLEMDELPPALAELQGKLAADDPYIKGLRVARNRPGVVRVVLDLKAEVKPQLFTLPPIAEYGHRLVLDALAANPILDLGMRLGEGSGAAVALSVVRLACSLHNGMATFAEASVSGPV